MRTGPVKYDGHVPFLGPVVDAEFDELGGQQISGECLLHRTCYSSRDFSSSTDVEGSVEHAIRSQFDL
jgi:hypothetical protein